MSCCASWPEMIADLEIGEVRYWSITPELMSSMKPVPAHAPE